MALYKTTSKGIKGLIEYQILYAREIASSLTPDIIQLDGTYFPLFFYQTAIEMAKKNRIKLPKEFLEETEEIIYNGQIESYLSDSSDMLSNPKLKKEDLAKVFSYMDNAIKVGKKIGISLEDRIISCFINSSKAHRTISTDSIKNDADKEPRNENELYKLCINSLIQYFRERRLKLNNYDS